MVIAKNKCKVESGIMKLYFSTMLSFVKVLFSSKQKMHKLTKIVNIDSQKQLAMICYNIKKLKIKNQNQSQK